MTILIWLIAVILMLFFLWIAGMNAFVAYKGYVRHEETPSWIPLIGGVGGCIGVLVLPIDGASSWWWLPLVLDWGCLPGTLLTLTFHAWRAIR